jgi:epoxide hydrolase
VSSVPHAAAEPFELRISDAQLADLQRRLRDTRWPERETVDDWSQGIPLAYLRDLVDYWATQYDWRAREALINRFPQFRALVGDLRVHFYHVRSHHAHAVPVLLTHGWPGSVVEFLKVIDPLTTPEAHGGDARDAFHVVCPSLPGYGFSDKPRAPGCGVTRIAALWDELMQRLGYASYFAQGGDWGAAVTTEIAVQNLGHCRGIHLNMPIARPPPEPAQNPTPAEQRAYAAIKSYAQSESGYAAQQSTRPQTLGYGLVDSPVSQCAWIVEKFRTWTDCDGTPENAISRDELLDNVMMYWLPGTGASSARLYWESFRPSFASALAEVKLPTGCSQFAKELSLPPRAWVERRYTNLVYWNEVPRGGHFAAFEQPAAFVHELRACFGLMRPTVA